MIYVYGVALVAVVAVLVFMLRGKQAKITTVAGPEAGKTHGKSGGEHGDGK